ncbi:MAG: UbiA family prenyltransferase [Ginsengibacter sp.]
MNQHFKSTFQLLRFHFSFFLMPVYWFALSQVELINWRNAILIFFILHFLVYPASNGYNSFMDRDSTPIGGIKNPLQPTKQLLVTTTTMNVMAMLLSLFISYLFAVGILLYILASLAYSYRGIRLKKFPIIGFLTVIIFQGTITFFLIYHGANMMLTTYISPLAILAAGLLIGGFYPLTQIFQHEADLKDGVTTISYLLGYRGTFVFTGIIYAFGFIVLGWLFFKNNQVEDFFILQIFMLPVFVYFFYWFYLVTKNIEQANYENTMRMNVIASVCTNAGFITILILGH